MKRKPITVERWFQSTLTWPEFRAQEERRTRLRRWAGLVALVALAVILGYVAAGVAVAR